jgi:Flp pilus assembly protein TadG
MTRRRFFADASGAAAVEMALVTPMLLALMFGGLEAGHFFWNEHKAVEAVRNGARYASRQPIALLCANDATTIANIKNMTRTGTLSSTATPVVTGWTSDNQVTVTPLCAASDYLNTGIYTTNIGPNGAATGATVTVSTTNLVYPSLFKALSGITTSYRLNAWSSGAVIGI